MSASGQLERLPLSRLSDRSQITYPTFDGAAVIDGNAPLAVIQSLYGPIARIANGYCGRESQRRVRRRRPGAEPVTTRTLRQRDELHRGPSLEEWEEWVSCGVNIACGARGLAATTPEGIVPLSWYGAAFAPVFAPDVSSCEAAQ